MAKVLELCGMIHSKYESESSFANAIGWSKQRVNKITNGKKEPNIKELAQISAGLDVSFERVANIFLERSQQMDNYQG